MAHGGSVQDVSTVSTNLNADDPAGIQSPQRSGIKSGIRKYRIACFQGSRYRNNFDPIQDIGHVERHHSGGGLHEILTAFADSGRFSFAHEAFSDFKLS